MADGVKRELTVATRIGGADDDRLTSSRDRTILEVAP
jgi:hypothetical protein